MNKTLLGLPTKTAHQTRGVFAAVAVILAIIVAGMAAAQSGPPQGGGDRSGPPTEALAACKSKAVEDVCQMTLPRGGQTVQGQCVTTPDKKLACLPEGAPQPKG